MKSKGFNCFHIKLKSPVPVYGRTWARNFNSMPPNWPYMLF